MTDLSATDPDVPPLAQHVGDSDTPPRPFAELSPSGLLWLINAVVFHPRGFALALVVDRATGDKAAGWQLLGDGTEPWQYDTSSDDRFAAAEATLRAAARAQMGLPTLYPSRMSAGSGPVGWVGQEPDKDRNHERG